jgi:hypothetical protein
MPESISLVIEPSPMLVQAQAAEPSSPAACTPLFEPNPANPGAEVLAMRRLYGELKAD